MSNTVTVIKKGSLCHFFILPSLILLFIHHIFISFLFLGYRVPFRFFSSELDGSSLFYVYEAALVQLPTLFCFMINSYTWWFWWWYGRIGRGNGKGKVVGKEKGKEEGKGIDITQNRHSYYFGYGMDVCSVYVCSMETWFYGSTSHYILQSWNGAMSCAVITLWGTLCTWSTYYVVHPYISSASVQAGVPSEVQFRCSKRTNARVTPW